MITWSTLLVSIDKISATFLELTCLDQVLVKLDVNYETFTLVLLNSIELVEGETTIDLCLIIGNFIDVFLLGIVSVFTLWF